MPASSRCLAFKRPVTKSSPSVEDKFLQQVSGNLHLLADGETEPQPELRVVLNKELDQAGPRPCLFFVQGVVGRLPP
jgi:hypothetical protein